LLEAFGYSKWTFKYS